MNTTILALIFTTATQQFALPNGLLPSLCYVETKHDVNAVHYDDGGSDSLGICQIKLSTAKSLGFKGTQKQLMLPNTNIFYAAKFLRYQITRYHGNITKAVVAYNKGNAKNLTRSQYSDKVFKQMEVMR